MMEIKSLIFHKAAQFATNSFNFYMRQQKAFRADIFFKFDLGNDIFTMTLTYNHFENKFNQLRCKESPTKAMKLLQSEFEPYDFHVIWSLMMQYSPPNLGKEISPNLYYCNSLTHKPIRSNTSNHLNVTILLYKHLWNMKLCNFCMVSPVTLKCDWKEKSTIYSFGFSPMNLVIKYQMISLWIWWVWLQAFQTWWPRWWMHRCLMKQ